MKPEDFVVGRWYRSSDWINTIAAKFSELGNSGIFRASEKISTEAGTTNYTLRVTGSYDAPYKTYYEVPLSEIQQYLPDGHIDKQPQYVRCIGDNPIDFGTNGIGKVFKVLVWNHCGNDMLLETHNGSVSSNRHRFVPASQEEFINQLPPASVFPETGWYRGVDPALTAYLERSGKKRVSDSGKDITRWTDNIWWFSSYAQIILISDKEYSIAQLTPFFNKEDKFTSFLSDGEVLGTFPTEGFCRNTSPDFLKLLKEKYPKCNNYIKPGALGLAWGGTGFYSVSIVSGKREYKIEQLKKFINPNSQTNVRHQNHKVSTITSEISRRAIIGAIVSRGGGQQIATGSRPTGNAASVNVGATGIRSIKISPNLGFRENP